MKFFEELDPPMFVQDMRSKLQSLLYVVPLPFYLLTPSEPDISGCMSWLDMQGARSVAYVCDCGDNTSSWACGSGRGIGREWFPISVVSQGQSKGSFAKWVSWEDQHAWENGALGSSTWTLGTWFCGGVRDSLWL